VGTDFGAFLDQADGNVRAFFGGELLESNRRGKAGRAAATMTTSNSMASRSMMSP
jgi:hypothetical protein